MPNDNLTTKDYFDLSDDAYLNMSFSPEQENGWTVLNQTQNPDTGYEAVAFKAPNGEIIIAHRGSDSPSIDREALGNPIKDWTESNLAIIKGEVPPQFHDADAFAQEIIQEYGSEITHTGHSLGGALAQLAAHKNGGNAVTFDPPGTSEVIQNSDLFENEINHDQFKTLLVQNSMVSSVNTQIGNLTKIDLYDGDSGLLEKGIKLLKLTESNIDGTHPTIDDHSMDSIRKAFAENGEIEPSFLSNMSTVIESDVHEFVEKFTGQDESMDNQFSPDYGQDTVLNELNSDNQFTSESGFVLPDQLPATGADASDAAVLDIASELESNINLMYTNLEKLSTSISGI